jgi:hypothetical protein
MTASDLLPSAWEPLTPRDVAAFTRAKFGRLFLVQFIVALLVAAALVWFLYDGCFPTVRYAIRQMPDTGEIRSGKLDWRGDAAQLLAEGTFFAFSVNREYAGDIRSPAHWQIEFGREDMRIHSLLGYREASYPTGWIIAFNRKELEPWFGAWQPALLALTALGVVVLLMASWLVLATLYAVPVWVAGFFANRDLSLGASWRLAGAALLPGALLMAGAILLYDFGVLDLVRMAVVTLAHLVLGWVYLGVSLLFLPRPEVISAEQKNPFVATPQ